MRETERRGGFNWCHFICRPRLIAFLYLVLQPWRLYLSLSHCLLIISSPPRSGLLSSCLLSRIGISDLLFPLQTLLKRSVLLRPQDPSVTSGPYAVQLRKFRDC